MAKIKFKPDGDFTDDWQCRNKFMSVKMCSTLLLSVEALTTAVVGNKLSGCAGRYSCARPTEGVNSFGTECYV